MHRKQSRVVVAVLGIFFLVLLQAVPAAYGQRKRKYKEPPVTSHIEVMVVRASNGKPVHNAAVVFHPTKDDKNEGNMELKTNEQGKTALDMIPVGSTVLLQVIANGYRTFGQEYTINADKKTILVKLELPKNQYSTYKDGTGPGTAQTNAPQSQMGTAAPTDSPLLTPPPKKSHWPN
ncbi:MAG TPA: hypothetical protein VHX63_08100 [Acidobacteriaceae bacterium]|jgi:hypothetical protein|nr:hypothetical protein [Acidobacteriaceae bacterium]